MRTENTDDIKNENKYWSMNMLAANGVGAVLQGQREGKGWKRGKRALEKPHFQQVCFVNISASYTHTT